MRRSYNNDAPKLQQEVERKREEPLTVSGLRLFF
jgi:hypothetical protein